MDFLFLSQKFVRSIYPQRVTGVKTIYLHSDNNHNCIIGSGLKKTFSLLKHHCSLWLDFFILDIFSSEDASFVKLKAALDLDQGNNKAAFGCAFYC